MHIYTYVHVYTQTPAGRDIFTCGLNCSSAVVDGSLNCFACTRLRNFAARVYICRGGRRSKSPENVPFRMQIVFK